ncbi:MAG: 2,3-bisphosphoglycerate-dependent phosphoglycerate mutase, partial [Acidobacteria bacterium]|nr:2,3-bisphosphoglycerate-dependent phosphoglycerate mutase [Acidobacteriota bacterium]
YGVLEGHKWNDVIRQRGQDWWDEWRRDYSLRPDNLPHTDERHPQHDPRYRHLPGELLRGGESVHDMMERIAPVWQQEILPALAAGKPVLVAVHGIAIRALDEMIREGSGGGGERMREIPNAAPVVYRWQGGRVDASSRQVLLPVAVAPPPAGGPDGSE